MTENEVFEHISNLAGDYKCFDEKISHQESLILCNLIEEIQQYRAIGTVEQLEWCKDASHWKELFKEKLEKYEAIGTIEEFKALKEKNEPKKIEFMHNRSDIVSVWKCHCGNVFLTKHKEGILDGTDVNYCCKCGQKIDWGDDNE